MSPSPLEYPRTYPDDTSDHTLIPTISRPTIILVHGGWQGPETFSLIIPGLEKAGYSVFAVTLPSASVVPAVPDFSSDVAVIKNAVNSTLAIGKDVLLVMHSFGAVVGCEAMKGMNADEAPKVIKTEGPLKRGRILRLAFIAGLVFPVGKATREESRGEDPIPGFISQDNLIRMLDGPSRFYNDLPPDEAAFWAGRLTRHSRLAFASPLTYAAYRDFPSSYLMCTEDKAIPYTVQKQFVAMARIKDTTTIKSGHSPMISQPKAVEYFIRKCAREEMPRL